MGNESPYFGLIRPDAFASPGCGNYPHPAGSRPRPDAFASPSHPRLASPRPRASAGGPVAVFGEIGILEETRRTADVRARSDVEVLALDWRDFKDLLDASDPTARDFMRIVEQRRAALPA